MNCLVLCDFACQRSSAPHVMKLAVLIFSTTQFPVPCSAPSLPERRTGGTFEQMRIKSRPCSHLAPNIRDMSVSQREGDWAPQPVGRPGDGAWLAGRGLFILHIQTLIQSSWTLCVLVNNCHVTRNSKTHGLKYSLLLFKDFLIYLKFLCCCLLGALWLKASWAGRTNKLSCPELSWCWIVWVTSNFLIPKCLSLGSYIFMSRILNHWELEIRHGGSVCTTDMNKCYKSFLFLSGVLV